MRTKLVLCFSVLVLAPLVTAQSQTTTTAVPRDATAAGLLQQSIAAMGGSAPADSTATGTITYVAGSLSETGTIQILTRGTGQTLEQIVTPHVNRTIVYSQFQASVTNGDTTKTLPLEAVATIQGVDFPLPFLIGAYNNPDIAIQYVGSETLNGVSVQHLRLWNTLNSQPDIQNLSSLTTRDIWLDGASSLPVQIAYGCWANTYANVTIPVVNSYSGYQTVGGYAHPSSIAILVNGTPSISATIQSIKFNTGLSDSNFPTQPQEAAQ
jgi:hypothetical protein